MTTLVFVDDEPNILNAIKRLMRRKDWTILTFSSPREALFSLQDRDDVELIISDYRMPDINGVELLNLLKESCPRALRILLSGHADLDGILLAINQAEIYRFVTKPWVDEELIITLEKALQHQALIQENIRLSTMIRQQQAKINAQELELKRLEHETPGITKVDWNEDGSIDISGEFDSGLV